jgi:hypothetical protein
MERVGVRILNRAMSPITEQQPTSAVIAISVAEKDPDMTFTQPSKYIQMSDMRQSQNRNIGAATHFANQDFLMASHTTNQTGAV